MEVLHHPLLYWSFRMAVKELDRNFPGWEVLVNRPIRIISGSDCVLGQVYGNWLFTPRSVDRHRRAFLDPAATRMWFEEIMRRRAGCFAVGTVPPHTVQRRGVAA